MKSLEWRRVSKRGYFVVAVGALIGAIVFLLVYGLQVIIPTNVDWLLTGGDLSQHYIGWEFFRNSAWSFPIGVAGDLAYPHGLAITFMDALPLLAVPMKLFAGWLPEQFQYFGLWGLFSYAALGSFAAAIVRRWTKDWWMIVPAVLFICLSPIVFQRMFTHTALAGHWIILFAVYAVLRGRAWELPKNSIVWSVILSLSVLIHPYFLAMNVFVLLVAVVIRHKTMWQSIVSLTVPIISALLTTWLIGGFTFTTISGQKFGEAGYDIAAPLLSNGWSVLSLSLAQTKPEMFAYVGLGGLLLLAAAMITTVKYRHKIMMYIRHYPRKTLAVGVVVLLLLIAAIGPGVKIAGVPIVHIDLPAIVEKVWGIFRVTARLLWPLWYAILFGSLYILIRFEKDKQIARILIAVICIVQVVDITASPQLQERRERFAQVQDQRFVSELSNPEWDTLTENRKHIVYLGDLYESKFITIAQFSIEHNLTLNTGYFARKPTTDIEGTINEAKGDLRNGTIKADTIYMYDKPFAVASGVEQKEMNGYFVTVR
ncbi:MAG: DUF6311 domain-containing protein [Candidatus Saccharimonadales bacterium]